MPWLLLVLILVAAVAVFLWLRRSTGASSGTTSGHRPPRPELPLAQPPAPAAPVPAVPAQRPSAPEVHAPAAPMPEALARFVRVRADALPADTRAALVEALKRIPRPPQSLHQLVSPDFIASASSLEMSELVMAEPQIAAKVLATVNSPLYGLQKTVVSIGQAITFLGMNAVRGIALQHMLNDAFPADNPEARRRFEQLWTASAVASELCGRLSKQLALPDAGGLLTHLVLSFLGHMAVASLAHDQQHSSDLPATDLSLPLPQRYQAQQELLGLCAPEIGRLLMREWGLPDSIIDGVDHIDQVMSAPPQQLAAPHDAARTAVAYLSARLGERLASGVLSDLGAFVCGGEPGADASPDPSPDMYHCHSYLALPALAPLPTLLAAPDNIQGVNSYLASRRTD